MRKLKTKLQKARCCKHPLNYIVMFALRQLSDKLEKICFLTHWLNPLLIKLHLPHCLPTLWSYFLDKKFELGVWKKEQT